MPSNLWFPNYYGDQYRDLAADFVTPVITFGLQAQLARFSVYGQAKIFPLSAGTYNPLLFTDQGFFMLQAGIRVNIASLDKCDPGRLAPSDRHHADRLSAAISGPAGHELAGPRASVSLNADLLSRAYRARYRVVAKSDGVRDTVRIVAHEIPLSGGRRFGNSNARRHRHLGVRHFHPAPHRGGGRLRCSRCIGHRSPTPRRASQDRW